MFNGEIKNIKDIRVNDLVMGWDYTPRTVLSTTKGVGQLYKISKRFSESYFVNKEHILCLRNEAGLIRKVSVETCLENPEILNTYCAFHSLPNYRTLNLRFKLTKFFLEYFYPNLEWENTEQLSSFLKQVLNSLNYYLTDDYNEYFNMNMAGTAALKDLLYYAALFNIQTSVKEITEGHYRVVFYLESKIIFPQNSYFFTDQKVTITEDFIDDYYGFMLDKDHMFLLPNYEVVHNSVVYQVPALMLEGTAIIISPLLALMDDQIQGLEKKRNHLFNYK